jgi:hypothetical protein
MSIEPAAALLSAASCCYRVLPLLPLPTPSKLDMLPIKQHPKHTSWTYSQLLTSSSCAAALTALESSS